MRLVLLVAAALSIGFGPVSLAAESPETSLTLAKASLPFLVDLPPGFEVRSRTNGLDEAVYEIFKDGETYVGIAVGPDAAAFPIVDDEDVRLVRRSKSLVVAIRGEGADAYIGEYLWTVSASQEMHVWGYYGDGIDQKVAWAIMASVKPRS